MCIELFWTLNSHAFPSEVISGAVFDLLFYVKHKILQFVMDDGFVICLDAGGRGRLRQSLPGGYPPSMAAHFHPHLTGNSLNRGRRMGVDRGSRDEQHRLSTTHQRPILFGGLASPTLELFTHQLSSVIPPSPLPHTGWVPHGSSGVLSVCIAVCVALL